jgi:hypothetical protein
MLWLRFNGARCYAFNCLVAIKHTQGTWGRISAAYKDSIRDNTRVRLRLQISYPDIFKSCYPALKLIKISAYISQQKEIVMTKTRLPAQKTQNCIRYHAKTIPELANGMNKVDKASFADIILQDPDLEMDTYIAALSLYDTSARLPVVLQNIGRIKNVYYLIKVGDLLPPKDLAILLTQSDVSQWRIGTDQVYAGKEYYLNKMAGFSSVAPDALIKFVRVNCDTLIHDMRSYLLDVIKKLNRPVDIFEVVGAYKYKFESDEDLIPVTKKLSGSNKFKLLKNQHDYWDPIASNGHAEKAAPLRTPKGNSFAPLSVVTDVLEEQKPSVTAVAETIFSGNADSKPKHHAGTRKHRAHRKHVASVDGNDQSEKSNQSTMRPH